MALLLLPLLMATLPRPGAAQTAQTAPQAPVAPAAALDEGGTPAKYAGTYRIENWRALERRGMYHFFYLHPNGHFLLAAAWPDKEHSQFVGTWSVTDGTLSLTGDGAVDTSEGAWRVAFERSYRIRVASDGFVLEPEPRKNRYGLLGWPTPYHYLREQPLPNLPGAALPREAEAMAAHIAALLAQRGK